MDRYEFVDGSSSKFWQWQVRGDELVVEYGRIGGTAQIKTKSFADPATARAAGLKLVLEKTGKGYRPAKAAPKQKIALATKVAAASSTSFPGLADKTLKPLARKVEKLRSGFAIAQALRKLTGGDAETALELGWHLVEHHDLKAQTSRAVLDFLQNSETTPARAELIAELLTRVPDDGESDLMPAWTHQLNQLTWEGLAVAPKVFADRLDRMSISMRRGVTLARALNDLKVPKAEGLAVLEQLAHFQATGYGITTNSPLPYVKDGEDVDHALKDLGSLRTIALMLGSAADWDRLLLEATRRNKWGLLENVSSALKAMPLEELVALFVARDKANLRVFGDSSEAAKHARELMKDRADRPEAVSKALEGLPKKTDSELRTLLAERG